MNQYRQRKMEYFRGSPTPLRVYNIWLTLFTVFSLVTLTWKITTSGYEEPVYFLLDLLACGFAIIAFLSFVGFDKYTVFGNVAFLIVFLSCKIYRTLHFMGLFGGGAAAAPDPNGIAGAIDGAAMGGGMGMAMDGMGAGMGGGMMGAGMMPAPVPLSEDVGMLGRLISKLLTGPLKMTGDYTRFLVVAECELFGLFCIFFIIYFLSHWTFFKTPLAKLRERDS